MEMDASRMTDFANLSDLGPVAGALAGLAVGVLLGLAHFGSLWWNAQLFLSGGAFRAFGVQLIRFGILLAVLAGLAKLGALPLLSGALGLLLARGLLIRRLGSAA
jgi:F1F0 ATPase subunit 2